MQKETLEFINNDFKLPNHDNELFMATDIIEKLKQRLNKTIVQQKISDNEFIDFYEEVITILDYVGRLSIHVFNIEDDLEAMYEKQYRFAPALAKTLWIEHYHKLHHPYTLLKNRCFKIIDEFDEFYFDTYDKEPPNWKI